MKMTQAKLKKYLFDSFNQRPKLSTEEIAVELLDLLYLQTYDALVATVAMLRALYVPSEQFTKKPKKVK